MQAANIFPIIFLCMLMLNVSGVQTATASDEWSARVSELSGLRTYGVYILDEKVGWMSEEVKLDDRNGEPVAVIRDEMMLRMQMGEEQSETYLSSEVVYELSGDGILLSMTEEVREDESVVVRHVERVSDETVWILTSGNGEETTRESACSRVSLANAIGIYTWMADPRRKSGDSHSVWELDLEREDPEVSTLFSFQGRSTASWAGQATTLFELAADFDGLNGQSIHDSTGRLLRIEASVMSIRLENEQIAKDLATVGADMMSFSAIELNRSLADITMVESWLLRLTGVANMKIPSDHRQTIKKQPDGSYHLVLRRDFSTGIIEPLSDEKTYLANTPRYGLDIDAIRSVAGRLKGNSKDRLEVAFRIQHWVYHNLEPRYAANSSRAIDVYLQKAGDCTEHALLFVALARAAGIPAREVGGLVYIDSDGTPLLGWHAWAEIHTGEQWLSIDPAFDQVYVDAGHIKLSEGTTDMTWVNSVGKLKAFIVGIDEGRTSSGNE